jgi:hypothetical protein
MQKGSIVRIISSGAWYNVYGIVYDYKNSFYYVRLALPYPDSKKILHYSRVFHEWKLKEVI